MKALTCEEERQVNARQADEAVLLMIEYDVMKFKCC